MEKVLKTFVFFLVLVLFSGCSLNIKNDQKDDSVEDDVEVAVNDDLNSDGEMINDDSEALEDIGEVSLPGTVSYSFPFCLEFYNKDEFTEANVLEAFSHSRPYQTEYVSGLFDSKEIIELVSDTTAMSFCILDYQAFAFSFLTGEGPEFDNVAAIYYFDYFDDEWNFVTAHNDFRPVGDLYPCRILGYIDDAMVYFCSGGDGCAAFEKIYSLNIEGQTKLLKDCDYGCAVEGYEDYEDEYPESCRVDLIGEVLEY